MDGEWISQSHRHVVGALMHSMSFLLQNNKKTKVVLDRGSF